MSGGMRSVDKARGLLKQLFRTENADLDFGIYRIMNFKRVEIERFIDKDLIEVAEAEFKEFARAGAAELEKELENRKKEINDFVPGTIGEDWVILKNHDLPKVKEFIGALEEYRAASVSEEQVQDVFNHVYEFFSRYYEDGDFIPRTRYGGRDKYFVPYNGEEVLLHWATKDMYYVKTGEYFNKYSFRAGRFRVTFKLVEAQIEQGNVKGDKKFFILHDEDPVHFDEASDEVEIRFNYRSLTDEEKGKYSSRKTQDDLIDEALTKIGASLGVSSISGILRPHSGEEKSLMRKQLESYVARNTKDFFIHKDLKVFLSKELEFYLKNEVWDLNVLENTSESQTRLMMAKVKAIRGISIKTIEFIAHIEEFQKRLFKKKKFVLRTDYCLTLDLIPEEFYEEIGKNEEQVMEWKKLFNLEEETKGTLLSVNDKNTLNPEFLKAHKYLVLDTRHFNLDFKDRLLARFYEIDDLIKGIMIKSENYQALNLLLSKYDELVKCTYIDPPFNTGGDEFLYKDNYRHSSWLASMQDRLIISKNFLAKDGSIYVHIDYNENSRLRLLMDEIFNPQNFQTEIVWQRTLGHHLATGMDIMTDYIFFYTKTNNSVYNQQYRSLSDDDLDEKFPYIEEETGRRFTHRQLEQIQNIGSKGETRIIQGKEVTTDQGWRWSQETIDKRLEENPYIIYWTSTGRPRYKIYADEYKGQKIGNLWNDISPLSSGSDERMEFNTQKPEALIERIISSSSNKNDVILDFFLGSGTTTAVAHKLDRKWIGIEMGDFFDDYPLKRMKMVLAGEKSGISEKVDWQGGGFFKYQILEQYEDTLNNIEFIQSDSSIQSRLDRLPDYFLTYMLDYETKDSPTRISFKQFKTPFNYRIKTISGGEEKEEPVDLVETFNYLLGLHINLLRAFKDGDRLYKVVYGTRGNEQVAVIWRDTPDMDLKQDKGFIENIVLSDITPDTIYINGDSYLENAKPIEPEFQRLMGA
jgi:adenine-specific DNA-methyltransferase